MVAAAANAVDTLNLATMRLALATEKRKSAQLASTQAAILAAVDAAIPERVEIPMIPEPRFVRGKAALEEIALLHISDTQIGKITRTYNSEIAAQRLMLLAERVVRIVEVRRAHARIDEIHLALGGDIVEGEQIFPHQPHLIDQSVFDQAVRIAPTALVAVILYLLKHFARVKVFCVVGNHGRVAPKFVGSHPRTNWDRVTYHTIRTILLGSPEYPRNEFKGRLTIDIPDEFYYVDNIYDWGALFVHGDQISGGYAGFPFYGTAKKAWGWIDAIPHEWDYLYFGHFHTYTSGTLNHRQWYCNGTTESDNEYAQEQMAAAGFPVQRLQFFSAQYGMIADSPVYLADGRRSQAARRGIARG